MHKRGVCLMLIALISVSAHAQYINFSKYAWDHFDTTNSDIPTNYVASLHLDGKSALWVSTSKSQFFQIHAGGRWEHHPQSPVMNSAWLGSWAEVGNGRFLIAGDYGQLYKYVSQYENWDTLGINAQTSKLLVNDKGIGLLGCVGIENKVCLYQVINNKLYPLGKAHGTVFHIALEDNGDALVATKKGLFRFKQRRDGTYREDEELLHEHVFYEVTVDDNGKIWATCETDGFLYARESDGWRIYRGGPRELYHPKDGKMTYTSHNLLVLPDNRILISTLYNTGIAVFDGSVWKEYKPELKEKNDAINHLALGPDGTIWCGTSKNGLWAFRPAERIKPHRRTKRLRDTSEESKDKVVYEPEKPVEEGKTIPYIPDPSRKVKTRQSISTFADSVLIRIWDSQKIDGDIVSIYYNGETLIKEKKLTSTQDTFWVHLEEGVNEILLYAHNLGNIPPNTVTIMMTHGSKVLNVDLNSDMGVCERLLIRKRTNDGTGY